MGLSVMSVRRKLVSTLLSLRKNRVTPLLRPRELRLWRIPPKLRALHRFATSNFVTNPSNKTKLTVPSLDTHDISLPIHRGRHAIVNEAILTTLLRRG